MPATLGSEKSSGSLSESDASASSGFSSSGSSCACNWWIEVTPSGSNESFSFTVHNDSACDLTVTGYVGLGSLYFPLSLPVVIAGGDTLVFIVIDAQLEIAESFTVTTEECGSVETPTPPPV